MTSRRSIILGAAGAPLLASDALAAPARPGKATAQERANLRLVTDFCKAWTSVDAEALIPFLHPQIEYLIMEGGQTLTGHEAFRKVIGGWLKTMARSDWQIFRTEAFGDMVVTERIDNFYFKDPAKAPWHLKIAGMFIVRDGLIRYWRDYSLSGPPPKQG